MPHPVVQKTQNHVLLELSATQTTQNQFQHNNRLPAIDQMTIKHLTSKSINPLYSREAR